MLKRFHQLLTASVPAALVFYSCDISASKFSVDNTQDSGAGSLSEVIRAMNAISPGDGQFHTLYFRSDLGFDLNYPTLRNNVSFNVIDPYKVSFLSMLDSSAFFNKAGKGSLELNAPWNFKGDWGVIEGELILNTQANCQGQYVVSGQLSPQMMSYLGSSDITLSQGGVLNIPHEHTLLNNLIISTKGEINTSGNNFSITNLQGSGIFSKTGLGHLNVTGLNSFEGSYILHQGSMGFKDVTPQGKFVLNGGVLQLNHSSEVSGLELLLQKGSIEVKGPSITFAKSVHAKGSDVSVYLEDHKLTLDQGLNGWGIVSVHGPGVFQTSKIQPFCGHIRLNSLTFDNAKFSANTLYKLKDVTVNLTSKEQIDFTTRLDILPGTVFLNYQKDPLEINASIEGKGAVIAKGQNKLTLRSLSNFQGSWQQAAGTLDLQGRLHLVTIDPNAALIGFGQIENLDLQGALGAVITPLNDQNLINTSQALINGNVIVRPINGRYSPGSYNLLNADTIDLQNARVLAPAQFEGQLAQDGQNLKYALKNVFMISDYVDKMRWDDLAVASLFDQNFSEPGSDLDLIIAKLLTLKNDPHLFQQAFQGLQPAYFSALGLTQEYNFILARSALSNRMEELLLFPCAKQYIWDEPFAVWFDPVGDFTKQDPRQHDMGYHSATVGGFFGFDGKVGSSFRLGLTGGYTNSRVRWMEHVGKGIINSEYLAGYFLYKPNRFYLNGSLSGSYSHYNAYRYINIVDIKRQARHKNHGFGFEADFELGYIFQGKTQLQPYLRQSYVGLYQQKFNEHGAGSLDLSVDSKKFAMYRVDAGLIFSRCLDYKKWALTPEFSLSGIWEQELKTGFFQAKYIDSGLSYQVVGMKPKRLLVSPGVALDAVIKKYPMMIGVRYHGEFSSQFIDQRISGHIGYGF